ncbi:MAG TPA: Hsp20/alpha crystallin family protein [Verrucomicrobiales bacterium]|nr:Hsp20/alpha crystallin family protein [Verrucomicrobiales bacterium]
MSQSTKLVQSSAETPAQAGRWVKPRYTVTERPDAYEIRVLVPGATRETVQVSLKESDLEITARRSQSVDPSWKLVVHERPAGDYRLRLKLNVPVKDEAIAGKVDNGVLTVQLPLADELRPRRIEIE